MNISFRELDGSERKPDFFVVGAPKAGTTSLYNHLIQHPEIFMPVRKEPYFFGHWKERSEKDFEKYLDLFHGVPESKMAGEASTTYLYFGSAAEEIQEFNPDAKIIIGVRNPAERTYSHYWQHTRSKRINLNFEEELANEEQHLNELESGVPPGVVPPRCYIDPGHYKKHIERYIRTFSRDQMVVYLFDDLIEDPRKICQDVFEFLGVDPNYSVSTHQVHNSGGIPRSLLLHRALYSPMRIKEPMKKVLSPVMLSKVRGAKERIRQKNFQKTPAMKPETRAYLQEVFKDDILYVQELTGRDLSHWLVGSRI